MADSEVIRRRCDSCEDVRETTACGCQRFGAFVDGVDTARRVRGVARRTRRKVKRKRRSRSIWTTYRLVSASKARLRVDRSASEMPFRSRCMLARNAAASEASPIARVRRRAIRNYRPDERSRSENDDARDDSSARLFRAPNCRKGRKASVRRRAPRRRTHFSTRGARADGSRLERGGRESGRGGNGVLRRCLRRARRGRLCEIVDER